MAVFRLTPPPEPAILESEVDARIVEFLRREGWYVQRNHVGKFVPWAIVMSAQENLISQITSGEEPDFKQFRQRVTSHVVSMGEKGMADRTAIHPTLQPLFLETKRPGRVPDEHQMEWLLRMHARGFRAGSWDHFTSFTAWYYCQLAGKPTDSV